MLVNVRRIEEIEKYKEYINEEKIIKYLVKESEEYIKNGGEKVKNGYTNNGK